MWNVGIKAFWYKITFKQHFPTRQTNDMWNTLKQKFIKAILTYKLV